MTKKPLPAILLCAHGSRDRQAAKEFARLQAKIQTQFPNQIVKGGFLKFNSPPIMESLLSLYNQGAREIMLQPLTLYNADHTARDIPDIAARFEKNHPGTTLICGTSPGLGDSVVKAAARAITSVLPQGDRRGTDHQDYKLLVVGRGSSRREISDQTINLCRKLQEYFEFGDTRYCYSFGNSPALGTALEQAGESHYNHVIILPYLLFSGLLLTEIRREIEVAREKYPAFTFDLAPSLGHQEPMITAIIEKISALQSSFKSR